MKLASQEQINQLPVPPSLSRLNFQTSEVDPHFKPLQGYLRATLNGFHLQFKVSGVDILLHVCSPDPSEECFEIVDQLVEPSSASWEEICGKLLGKFLIVVSQRTLSLKQAMIDTGVYYVQ